MPSTSLVKSSKSEVSRSAPNKSIKPSPLRGSACFWCYGVRFWPKADIRDTLTTPCVCLASTDIRSKRCTEDAVIRFQEWSAQPKLSSPYFRHEARNPGRGASYPGLKRRHKTTLPSFLTTAIAISNSKRGYSTLARHVSSMRHRNKTTKRHTQLRCQSDSCFRRNDQLE